MTRPKKLQLFLQRAFARVGADYVRRLRAWLSGSSVSRRPDLKDWVLILAEQVQPLMAAYWRDGAKRSLRSIIGQLGKRGMRTHRKGLVYVVKDARQQPRIEFAWDLFNRRIEQAANEAVFAFCESTLDTIQGDIDAGLAELHTELLAGLEAGETLKRLTARVQSIFDDPDRALRIAHTETQRAVHGGQLLAAKESGVCGGKKWLASSDACDLCKSFAAMGEIQLDKPFWVNPKGGPYAVVTAPPGHPGCFCALLEVVDYNMVEAPTLTPLPGLAYRARLLEMEEVL